jgi:hypothetical protein
MPEREEEELACDLAAFERFVDESERRLERLRREWRAGAGELRRAVEELLEDAPPGVEEGEEELAGRMEGLRREVELLGSTQMAALEKSEKEVKRKWKAMQAMVVQTFMDEMEEE